MGLCYTFNHITREKRAKSSRPGARFGLVMRMTIENDEYTSGLDVSAGMKVRKYSNCIINVSFYKFDSYRCLFVSILSKKYFEKKVLKNSDCISRTPSFVFQIEHKLCGL